MTGKLTEADWHKVFRLRCESKRGTRLDAPDMQLIKRAFREDHDRYTAMGDAVFEETRPFGSRR